jgi:spore coat polysaccharide biosynthesis protein SpsF (cytidylyltransferase family)
MIRMYKTYYPKFRGMTNWGFGRTVSEGLDAEIYSLELLAELDRDLKCPREDFATYAAQNKLVEAWPLRRDPLYPIGQDIHLSIDTPEDFDRAERMLKILGNDEWRYEKTLEAYRQCS